MKRKSKLQFLWTLVPISSIVPFVSLTSCTNNSKKEPHNKFNIDENKLYQEINNTYKEIFNDFNNENVVIDQNGLSKFKNNVLSVINDYFNNSLSSDDLNVTNNQNVINLVVKLNPSSEYKVTNNNSYISFLNTNNEHELHIEEIDGNGFKGSENNPPTPDQPTPDQPKPPITNIININGTNFYNSLNDITKTCTQNEIASIAISSICSYLDNNFNLKIGSDDIGVEFSSNNYLNINISLDSNIKIVFNNNSSNVSFNNNMIFVKNLSYIYQETIPQPSYLKTPQLTPVVTGFIPQKGFNNNLTITSKKAYIGITDFATLDIVANGQLPKVKEQYKVYIDGVEQLVNGWFFGDQVNITNSVEVSQENGQLENHYLRVDILNSDNSIAASTGDMLLVRTTPAPTYQPPVVNKDYFIAPWCPSGSENDPKYWIVNPYTKNEWIKYNYGTIPLPMIPEVDATDCYNMFTTYALKMYAGQYKVGKRVISSEMMSNAFVKWTCEMWRYFPYFSYNNASLVFHNNPVDKFVTKQDVEGMATISKTDGGIYEQAFLKPFGDFKKFADSLQLFLSAYYRPGMKDLDKVFAGYLFTCDWIRYNGNLFSTVSHYTHNQGVCNNYSQMMSQVLNMMGVPAVPIITNVLNQVQHANVWVYIDKDNNGQKKWYASDPTWSDYSEAGYTGHPVSGCFYPDEVNNYWTLFDVSDNQDYFANSYNADHKNYFQYQGSRWYTPYKENQVSVGKWSLYHDALLQRPKNGDNRSRMNYYNDGWYYLDFKNNSNNRTLQFKKSNFGNKQPITINIPTKFSDIILKCDYETRYQYLGMAQYRDNFIFMNNQIDDGADIKIVVHNMNDTEWKDSVIIELPQLDKGNLNYEEKVQNFYINADKQLVVTTDKYRTFTFDQTVDAINKQNQIYSYNNDEVNFAAKYFEFLSGYIKIGNSNFNVTAQQKQDFFKNVNEILKSSVDNSQKVTKIYNLYVNFVNSSIKFTNSNIQSVMMPNQFVISNSGGFQEYGYSIPTPTLITNLDELIAGSNSGIVYDLYFSATSTNKTQMTQLFKGRVNADITQQDFNKVGLTGPNGYYYLKYYVIGQENKANETSVFSIQTNDNIGDQISSLPNSGIGRINDIYKITNVTKIPGWENQDLYVNYSFGSNLNQSTYDIQWELKYQNLNEGSQLQTLKSGTGTSDSYNIGLVSDNNHGLYYYDIKVVNKQTHDVNNLFSRFMFVLTENDCTNFDDIIQTFVNNIDAIIKNQNPNLKSLLNISK